MPFGIPVEYTAGGMLLVAVLLIFLGILIPRPFYKEKKEEAVKWEKAYLNEAAAHAITREQNTDLLEYAKLTYGVVQAMFETSEPPGKGGAHRVVPTSR